MKNYSFLLLFLIGISCSPKEPTTNEMEESQGELLQLSLHTDGNSKIIQLKKKYDCLDISYKKYTGNIQLGTIELISKKDTSYCEKDFHVIWNELLTFCKNEPVHIPDSNKIDLIYNPYILETEYTDINGNQFFTKKHHENRNIMEFNKLLSIVQ